MFCSNCGSRILDGSVRCDICGAAQLPSQPAQPDPGYTPNYNPAPAYAPVQLPQYDLGPSVPENYIERSTVKKKEFLKIHADAGTKRLMTAAWIVAALCLLCLILCVYTTFHASLFEFPVVNAAMQESNFRQSEFEDELEEAVVGLELQKEAGTISSSEYKDSLQVLKDWSETFSVNNIRKGFAVMEDYMDDSSVEDGLYAINALSAIAIGYMVFVGLLLLLGALIRSRVCVILSMLLALLYNLLLSTPLYLGLIFLTFVILTSIYGRIHRAYKRFKKGL